MNKKEISTIFKRFKQHYPHPTTELLFSNTFELLVAVILSAQATDLGVNKAIQKLFPVANTPEALLKLGVNGLKPYIKTIGLYNAKANNIINMCQILIDKFNGEVPKTREELETLPGVGRKTANVVLNIAFNKPTIPVDTHVFRVSNRIGLVHAKTVLETEKELLKVVPKEYLHHAGIWLVIHGRYICVARKPKCPQCFIRDLCEYPNKTIA
jgi:endonuclease-3